MHDVDEQFSRLTASLIEDPVFRWRLRWARASSGVRACMTGLLVGSAALGVTYLGHPGGILDDVALGFRASALR